MEMAIRPKSKGDEAKISAALQRIMEEDCTVGYRQDAETAQQLIKGLGEQHLDVTLAKLKNKFGVEAEVSKPRVAYRETIRKSVEAEGKHKKQSGGHGQYGHVKIKISCFPVIYQDWSWLLCIFAADQITSVCIMIDSGKFSETFC